MKRATLLNYLGAACLGLLLAASAPADESLAYDSADRAQSGALELVRITPDGEDVPAGRQIVFRFDRPVVPVGRMERGADEIPIAIQPALKCQWRWLDTRSLACQLDEAHALRPATAYTVKVRPGIRTDNGVGMREPLTHRFITERPKVTQTVFGEWRAPSWPRIRVTFNQAVTRSSVAEHLSLRTAGASPKPYDIDVKPAENDRKPIHYAPLPDEPYTLTRPNYRSETLDDRQTEHRGEQARRVWMVEPRRALPADSEIDLRVEPGLVSALGPELGIESRTLVQFRTYPEFRFLRVECMAYGAEGARELIPPRLRTPANSPRCLPGRGVSLVFSAPVISAEVKDHLQVSPPLPEAEPGYNPWAYTANHSRLNSPHRQGQHYRVQVPFALAPSEQYRLTDDSTGIKDEFGRALTEPLEITFTTSKRPPELRLPHDKAVLEEDGDTQPPVHVTNLDALNVSYRTVTAKGRSDKRAHRRALETKLNVTATVPLGVREWLGGGNGAVTGVVKEEHRERGYASDPFAFFAQVTPFQVHVKLGHFNSAVWVTDLATGEAVDDARLTVYTDDYSLKNAVPHEDVYSDMSGPQKFWRALPFTEDTPKPAGTLATAHSDKDGVAYLPGLETLSPDLKLLRTWRNDSPRFFIRVDKGDDFALIPLDRSFTAWTRGVSSHNRPVNGHLHAWGTTAQGVYKVGDTIDYKFYVRNQNNRHWVAPPLDGYRLEVFDPTGKSVLTVEQLELSEFGAYHGELALPEMAASGWYSFQLSNPTIDSELMEPLRVLVTDFTPAPFRVTTELNGEQFLPGDTLEVSTQAQLHAGGPYANSETRTTIRLQERAFQSDHPLAKAFIFSNRPSYGHGYHNAEQLHQSLHTGDGQGRVDTRFTLSETMAEPLYGRLLVEAAVRDDRGKWIAAQTGAEYAGRDRYVGLRNTRWTHRAEQAAQVEYLVVDHNGEPTAGTSVHIDIERRDVRASRKAGEDGAELTRYITEWVDVASCEGTSMDEPSTCTFTPSKPGSYRITAHIEDTRERKHSVRIHTWVVGEGRVVWEEPNDRSLEIIPEQEEYKVGDTARFLVKNPFPGAEALISVERYGVLNHWTQTLDNSTAIIEVPVEPDYLPGFYLSILINSPRTDKKADDDNADPGKPDFRLGYITVPVKDAYKEVAINIETDRELYKPRDTVKATIDAEPRQGALGQPLEIVVAVIDEAVFDLNAEGRDYYDPYEGFNRLDPLDVNNYSLLTQLIDREASAQPKAERQAEPQAVGMLEEMVVTGARASSMAADIAELKEGPEPALRNLFKYVSYWNPSLKPGRNGKADIEFELPDNLTGWRIFAMAVTPDDRMGLGDTAIKVNQPTEVRPAMPNQVTEGDSFAAGFSVMNRTDNPRTIAVEIEATGALAENSEHQRNVELTLEPYKRQMVWLPVQTASAGDITFRATAGDASDGDAIEHRVVVNKRRSLVTAANYGTTTQNQVTDRVAFPDDIFADTGGISVMTSPSVIGNIGGAFEYMRDYPHLCWEQRLTKAVMASHYHNLRDYLPDDVSWQGSETLPQTVLNQASALQAPNGGMAYWRGEDEYVSPYLSAYTALAFNWLRKSGYNVPGDVEERLHEYLIEMLKRDVMPSFFTQGMASSVRAVALAALAEHGEMDGADLLDYQPYLKEMDLFAKAHFLQAASHLDGTAEVAEDTVKQILAQASQSGGKFQFNEPWDDSYSYILATPLRSNCAVLSALMHFTDNAQALKLVGDIPFKQVRAITQSRGNRDHWENTQENVFCLNALTEYARVYESEKPDMTVTAYLDDKAIGETRYTDLRDEAVTFEDPVTQVSPGLKTDVRLTKEGAGRLYYATRMQYAPTADNAERINAGIDIRREYSVERDGEWILLEDPMRIERGELVRVDMYLSLPTLRHFVVVDDPVPGGLEPVNRDLATASTVDADKGAFKAADGAFWFQYSDWSYYGRYGYSFYHKELRHHAARFYADYLPAGNYHLSYTAQAIAAGEFSVMPVHAEEMYDPNVFGKGGTGHVGCGGGVRDGEGRWAFRWPFIKGDCWVQGALNEATSGEWFSWCKEWRLEVFHLVNLSY